MLSMIGSLQVLIVENIQYILVSSELFKKKTPSYALKLFSLYKTFGNYFGFCRTITYWFCQWYHKNFDLNKYNIGMT